MAFSAASLPNPPAVSYPHRSFRCCHLPFNQKHRFLVIPDAQKRKNHSPLVIRPVLNKVKSDSSSDNNGEYESAKVHLERLSAIMQKVRERMVNESSFSVDGEVNMDFDELESDSQAVLSVLRKKEEDLQDAERRVLLENARFNCTKQVLEQREKEIATAWANQKQMEEELMKVNGDVASLSGKIEDLKRLAEDQGKKTARSLDALSRNEDEMAKLRNELMKKNDEAAIMASKLSSKEQLLNETNEVIKGLEATVEKLQREVAEKEHDLAKSLQLRKMEEARLKIVEANLEMQTEQWLSARELEELTEQASKCTDDVENSEDFNRVRPLLADVRSELISTQGNLVSSYRKNDNQTLQLQEQLAELNEQKDLVDSLKNNLKDVQSEVESEKTKLRDAHAKRERIESQLLKERELIEHMQEELKRESSCLERAIQERELLRKELQQKGMEYSDSINLLQVKEFELGEARFQIQHLKSEQASLELILQEKDDVLLSTQKELSAVTHDIAELQSLLNSREGQLIQADVGLREKEKHALPIQPLLNDKKVESFEVTPISQQGVQFTRNIVVSVNGHGSSILPISDEGNRVLEMEHDAKFLKQKQLETEPETTEGLHREKEMDFLDMQVVPTHESDEPITVLRRLDMREEMEDLKEELQEDTDKLKEACSPVQDSIGDRNAGGLIIKNIQVEAGKLEAESATSALHRLEELTRQLVRGDGKCIGLSTGGLKLEMHDAEMDNGSCVNFGRRFEGLEYPEREVAHLFALTELLVMEAGISNA